MTGDDAGGGGGGVKMEIFGCRTYKGKHWWYPRDINVSLQAYLKAMPVVLQNLDAKTSLMQPMTSLM